MCCVHLPGEATVGAGVGPVDAGRARAQRELRNNACAVATTPRLRSARSNTAFDITRGKYKLFTNN